MNKAQETLPHWDMTPVFPSLESSEFKAEFAAVLEAFTSLEELWNACAVRRRPDSAVTTAFVADFEAVTSAYNDLIRRLEALGAYINCFVTTDAANETARSYLSELETRGVLLGQLSTRLVAWVGSCDLEALLAASPLARQHEHWVRRAGFLEKHQMTEAEENLAASLSPMGLSGWASLHSNMTALLCVPLELRGKSQLWPMSSLRALAADADREVRRVAFEAEIAAWKTVAVPLGAALNGIKGFQRTVRERRGYTDDVAPTLVTNSIDAATLTAMQDACIAATPAFERYMRAKAKALGVEKLAWYDLIAPLGGDDKRWSWPEAKTFITENFGHYSERLAQFAQDAFSKNWIDAQPRTGKVGGGYCTALRPGESRVLMNFTGSFTDVSTLAHELGHAYHNLCLKERTPLQGELPMTLAETASIFCETIVFEAAVARADAPGRLALLDNALSRNLQVVVDIHSRFLFEKAVFAKRGERDLTESEFCALMTQAQKATYGPDVEPLHPYMWAVKGHYYGPTFYNYPYTFGLLLGLGLYAQYQADPEPFRERYDSFLSRCGMADAATLAADFGFNLTGPDFWRSSLQIIEKQIEDFETMVG